MFVSDGEPCGVAARLPCLYLTEPLTYKFIAMKKLLAILIFAGLAGAALAQEGFHYKILLSQNGQILRNQQVEIRFNLSDTTGVGVYSERHVVTTDDNGIATMVIGEGVWLGGNFSDIDWSKPYTLTTFVSTDGGGDFYEFRISTMCLMPNMPLRAVACGL